MAKTLGILFVAFIDILHVTTQPIKIIKIVQLNPQSKHTASLTLHLKFLVSHILVANVTMNNMLQQYKKTMQRGEQKEHESQHDDYLIASTK